MLLRRLFSEIVSVFLAISCQRSIFQGPFSAFRGFLRSRFFFIHRGTGAPIGETAETDEKRCVTLTANFLRRWLSLF